MNHAEVLRRKQPLCTVNPHAAPFARARRDCPFDETDVQAAQARWQRFAGCLNALFPETGGMIESPLRAAPALQAALNCAGVLRVKCDSELPVAGSVKARGGIYEVLCHAEELAWRHGLLTDENDDYAKLAAPSARQVFAQHRIAVGSTGNLGLSIGITAARFGFRAEVHMSSEARAWKKRLLREAGAQVFEYAGDYGEAVAAGRQSAAADPFAYFVDDEHSSRLFLGYACAGARLKAQLDVENILISQDNPLYVYLPCGVGGAPGGITFGLKLAFGDAVKCVFAEPLAAPCVAAGVLSGRHENICVQDLGLDGRTLADGLAVARPSALVCGTVGRMIEAFATVSDRDLLLWQARAWQGDGLKWEPSACAGLAALPHFAKCAGVHIVWATGGGLMPDDVFADYLAQAA